VGPAFARQRAALSTIHARQARGIKPRLECRAGLTGKVGPAFPRQRAALSAIHAHEARGIKQTRTPCNRAPHKQGAGADAAAQPRIASSNQQAALSGEGEVGRCPPCPRPTQAHPRGRRGGQLKIQVPLWTTVITLSLLSPFDPCAPSPQEHVPRRIKSARIGTWSTPPRQGRTSRPRDWVRSGTSVGRDFR